MEPEKLMSELSWLKRLASALVRDESDANDVVQETLLLAAEHAPTDGRPLKPWLRRVALNVVRMRSRASTRRRAREVALESFAKPSPTPDELLSRVEAQRTVVDAVLELGEQYRNTILLHYFEELSSAEIARRFGIPEGTVRRRLKVGLDELRARLRAKERETGRPVLAVLAPIAVKPSTAALGVVLVKKVIALVVVAVGLLFVGSQLYKHHARASEPVAVPEDKRASGTARTAAMSGDGHVVIAVVDSTGPVANALVRCAPMDGDVVVVRTASDGNASIELAAGQWSIAASADGHEPAATTLIVIAGRDDRVKLVLSFGGQTLTGTVTDITGGVIAGARIDAARLDTNARAGGAVAIAVTDRAGHYKLAVGAGEIVVAASHPDYAPQTRYVDLGTEGATANFALVPGGVIEGVVRDQKTKQPVAGAAVLTRLGSAALEFGEAHKHVVISGIDGTFRVAGLRPGAYRISAREGARSTRAPVDVGLGVAAQQGSVVVFIEPAATIRGQVVDDADTPVPKITVHAHGNGESVETVSDETGAFIFEGLAPDRWVLRGLSDSYVYDGQVIVQLENSDVDGIVVRVRHGLEVTGHVEPRKACDVAISMTAVGSPAPRYDSKTTTADGEFHFGPFPSGSATLLARCTTGEEGSLAVAVAASGGDNIIPLSPGGSIEGRVVDGSGKPVAGVMVNAEASGSMTQIENGAVTSGLKGLTSTTGAFEIGSLGAGSYRLSVLDTGRPMKAKKPVSVAITAGQHATGVEFVVDRPDGTIQGTVTGSDGAPIAEAWVSLHQNMMDQTDQINAMRDPSEPNTPIFIGDDGSSSRDPTPAMTDAQGHFVMTNLVRGRYQVAAEAQGGKLRGSAADVVPNAQITVRLANVSSLQGTVHGSSGPTNFFSVHLTGPTSADRSFTDGAFVFSRLDPGAYTIDVESTDGTGQATAQVSSDGGATVDIALVANGTVTGRVVDKTGKPLSGRGVMLIPDQPPGQLHIEVRERPMTSGPNGRFQAEGPPGLRTIVIEGLYPTAKRGVPVTSGKTLDVGDVPVDDQPK